MHASLFLAIVLAVQVASAAVTTRPGTQHLLSAAIRQSNESEGPSPLLQRVTDLRARIQAVGGCPIDICFALDGSNAANPESFKLQQDFTQLTALVLAIDRRAHYTAVQYGTANIEISELTPDVTQFVGLVANSTFANAPRTLISAGLLFCTASFRRNRSVNPRIVLFSDGRANIGPPPSRIVTTFLPPRGNGVVVAAGINDPDRAALAEITGRSDFVVSVHDPLGIPNALQTTIEAVCSLNSRS